MVSPHARRTTDGNADLSGNLPASSAVERAMEILLKQEKGIPQELLKAASPAIAGRFSFTVVDTAGHLDDGFMAMVVPTGMPDESKLSHQVVKHICPEAEYVDDCVYGLWKFGAAFDTPSKIAAHLSQRGFILNSEEQDMSLLE